MELLLSFEQLNFWTLQWICDIIQFICTQRQWWRFWILLVRGMFRISTETRTIMRFTWFSSVAIANFEIVPQLRRYRFLDFFCTKLITNHTSHLRIPGYWEIRQLSKKYKTCNAWRVRYPTDCNTGIRKVRLGTKTQTLRHFCSTIYRQRTFIIHKK